MPLMDEQMRDPRPTASAPQRSSRYEPPSVVAHQQRQSERLMLLVLRLLFLVLLVTVTVLTLTSQGQSVNDFRWPTFVGLLLATTAIGTIVVVVDAMTPNKRLSSVVGIYLGICFGLIGAVALGGLIDVVASAWELQEGPPLLYLGLAKVIIGIVLCYLSVSVVLTTKDDFRLVLPYVEFARQVRGIRPMLMDTSSLIDGRIDDLGHAGFIDAPLIVPQFVIDEMQTLADSSDKTKRGRGRRGLDLLAKLQQNPFLDVTIDDPQVDGLSVDAMLVELASRQDLRIMTTDSNLKKVAQINGITVLNVNDLASTLKAGVSPGNHMPLELLKTGENPEQAVGYMPDGTMVVVQDAAEFVGTTRNVVVTNTLQTAAGRMVFAKLDDSEQADGPKGNPGIRKSAVNQEPARGGNPDRDPETGKPSNHRQNPRR
ncbi:MAG: hypothetical protein MK085_12070 [Phycisphaerales bacterium]|nr:hypothetical protein [Phycisphaerales bacterium]